MGTRAGTAHVKLALDHHYSRLIAEQLRVLGHDAVAAVEQGWQILADAPLLHVCADESRALLTNNVVDFVVISRNWAVEGRSHHGLIFTSDRKRPRSFDHTGRFVTDLAELISTHDSFIDMVHWR